MKDNITKLPTDLLRSISLDACGDDPDLLRTLIRIREREIQVRDQVIAKLQTKIAMLTLPQGELIRLLDEGSD